MVHFIVGTRAQLFKLAPVMLACDAKGLAWRWVYTAQHRETIEQTVETFSLPEPDHVVVSWATEASSVGRMSRWLLRMLGSLPRSRKILANRTGKRHIVVTHGDTFTTWLGALMGKLTRTPVIHVESGLRSFDLRHPFPEEINRLITFRLSDYYACPGDWAVENLKRYRGEKLNTLANTQLDTIRFGLDRCETAAFDVPEERYVVVSIHRYENIFRPERFGQIIAELELLSAGFRILLVQHPATRLQIEKLGFRERLERNERISLLPRLEYLAFVKAISHAEFVVTDGGGNQEELSYLGKPTLLFRDETERREGLGDNAVLSKLDAATIADFAANYKSFERERRLPDGSPSEVIAAFLEERGFGSP
jgi:UDP-N-acetylglucosamine 2-epimerase (non-hydrolysing)